MTKRWTAMLLGLLLSSGAARAQEDGGGLDAGLAALREDKLSADVRRKAEQRGAALRAEMRDVQSAGVVRFHFDLSDAENAAYKKGEQAYIERRYADALRYLAPLVGNGHGPSHFYLARMLEMGRGLQRDYAQAARLYRVAIRKGSVTALYNLAFFYRHGDSVPKDPGKAADLFEPAAWRGDAGAMGETGNAYYRGDGRPRKLDLAWAWWKLGADRGNRGAAKMLETVAKELGDARAEAERTAAQMDAAIKAGEVPGLPAWLAGAAGATAPREGGRDQAQDDAGGEPGSGDGWREVRVGGFAVPVPPGCDVERGAKRAEGDSVRITGRGAVPVAVFVGDKSAGSSAQLAAMWISKERESRFRYAVTLKEEVDLGGLTAVRVVATHSDGATEWKDDSVYAVTEKQVVIVRRRAPKGRDEQGRAAYEVMLKRWKFPEGAVPDDDGAVVYKEYRNALKTYRYEGPSSWRKSVNGNTIALMPPGAKNSPTVTTMAFSATFQSFDQFVESMVETQKAISGAWHEKSHRRLEYGGRPAVRKLVHGSIGGQPTIAEYYFVKGKQYHLVLVLAAYAEDWNRYKAVLDHVRGSYKVTE